MEVRRSSEGGPEKRMQERRQLAGTGSNRDLVNTPPENLRSAAGDKQENRLPTRSADDTLTLPTMQEIRNAWALFRGQDNPSVKTKNIYKGGKMEVKIAFETDQPTHSFKYRGAFNEFHHLTPEDLQRGIIVASSGNHGLAIAYLAGHLDIPCTVVVPQRAPDAKVDAIQALGGTVIRYGATYDDADHHAQQLANVKESRYLHVASRHAIAGYGTIALELLEQFPNAQAIIVPVGGGALLAGVAIAAKTLKPDIKIIGAEPEGAACVSESLKAGKLVTLRNCETIADGTKVKTPDAHVFPLIQTSLVDEIVTIPEQDIQVGINLLSSLFNRRLEGAAILGALAVLHAPFPVTLRGAKGHEIALSPGAPVLTPFTGGNIDHIELTPTQIFKPDDRNQLSIETHRRMSKIMSRQLGFPDPSS